MSDSAAAAAVARLYYRNTCYQIQQYVDTSVKLTIWTVVECNIGIFAASFPCLTPLLRNCFSRIRKIIITNQFRIVASRRNSFELQPHKIQNSETYPRIVGNSSQPHPHRTQLSSRRHESFTEGEKRKLVRIITTGQISEDDVRYMYASVTRSIEDMGGSKDYHGPQRKDPGCSVMPRPASNDGETIASYAASA